MCEYERREFVTVLRREIVMLEKVRCPPREMACQL